MSDPIERQEVMDAIYKCTDIYVNNLPIMIYKAELYKAISELPSAQTEIIRCKDCKYCDRGIDEDGNPFLKCLGRVYGGTQEEDFCSHAERKT